MTKSSFKQLIILLVTLLTSVSPLTQAETSCNLIDAALNSAVEIRGLRLKKRVPCVLQEKAEVKDFILKSIDEQLTPEKLAFDATVYKALGLIPEDWDFKNKIIELYLSQIGGYYDPKKKRYVMAAWLPSMLQESIAVHELTHALQDQYYDLEKFHEAEKATTDEQLARAALIEGDATLVMLDHTLKSTNQPPLSEAKNVESLVLQQSLSMSMSPEIRAAPSAISYSLMFPYISGLRFTHNFLKQGGYKSIDKIYQQPPVSTEAILHPEKYSYHTREFSIPTDQEILAASGIPNATIKDSDTLGEFMLSLLLGSGNSKTQAALAAAGWAGDKVVLAKSTNATQVLLLTLWDTPKDAQEFLNAGKEFRGALAKEKLGHSNFDIPRIRELDPKKVLITVGVKE